MKKILWIIVILFFLTVIITGLYFYIQIKPKIRIHITYKIGWWADQDNKANLFIEDFNVQIVRNNPNLFNGKAIINYKITYKINFGYFIKSFYINERLINNDNEQEVFGHKIAEILIVPIIEENNEKMFSREYKDLVITNEHQLNTYRWGKNLYKFICGNIEKELVLFQGK